MSDRRITKEAFLESAECLTRGWFTLHAERGQGLSDAELFRMQEGMEVHRRARALHPSGVYGGDVQRTGELMRDEKVAVIFEAAFEVEGFAARADWIRRVPCGWVVGEIKSSLHNDDGPKDEHLDDLGYTVMVLRKSGLPVAGAELVLLNRSWRLGMNDTELFIVSEHSAEVDQRAAGFHQRLGQVRAALQGFQKPTPRWCWACRNCHNFGDRCVGGEVADPIFALPRLSRAKFDDLISQGAYSIHDVPRGFALTANQRIVTDAVQRNEPIIDAVGLRGHLDEINEPIGYLDFETMKTAVPVYPGVAPHEQIPTQFSLHVLHHLGAEPEHVEYLADHSRDCRRELAEQLIAATASCRTVTTYSSFERRVVRDLARLLPDLSDHLDDLDKKLLDLEPVVRKYFVDPAFGGRSSIKVVLPVIAPDLHYDGLAVGDGNTAAAAFARMARGEVDGSEIPRIRTSLLDYCRLDTLAMVRLHTSLAGKA